MILLFYFIVNIKIGFYGKSLFTATLHSGSALILDDGSHFLRQTCFLTPKGPPCTTVQTNSTSLVNFAVNSSCQRHRRAVLFQARSFMELLLCLLRYCYTCFEHFSHPYVWCRTSGPPQSMFVSWKRSSTDFWSRFCFVSRTQVAGPGFEVTSHPGGRGSHSNTHLSSTPFGRHRARCRVSFWTSALPSALLITQQKASLAATLDSPPGLRQRAQPPVVCSARPMKCSAVRSDG